jgi:hypothetical protein
MHFFFFFSLLQSTVSYGEAEREGVHFTYIRHKGVQGSSAVITDCRAYIRPRRPAVVAALFASRVCFAALHYRDTGSGRRWRSPASVCQKKKKNTPTVDISHTKYKVYESALPVTTPENKYARTAQSSFSF